MGGVGVLIVSVCLFTEQAMHTSAFLCSMSPWCPDYRRYPLAILVREGESRSMLQPCTVTTKRTCKTGFMIVIGVNFLTQKSEEAVTFAVGYLTIFLSHITNVQLMREFLFYLTVGECDGKSVLNYLIRNITTSNVQVNLG